MSYRDRDRDDFDRGTRSRDYDRAPAARSQPDAAPKIFVGNLHYHTSDDEFKSHFEHCGKIVEILVPRDPHNSNRVKGYGFVTFEDFESMQRAIDKMDGSKLLGNELKVDRAQERKERPAFNAAGGGRGGGYTDRGSYNDRSGGYSDRGRYDDRVSHPPRGERKPIGYRCRIAGLARDIGWQLLKDFLRQAGDVTYANVDPDGFGVGEYATYEECRDAIDKLSGAALDGNIVKLTALNFDLHTGERLDRGGDRGGGGGGYSSRAAAASYDDHGSSRGRGGDGGREYDRDRRDYSGDRDRRDYNAPRSYDTGRGGTGGSSYRPYDSSGGRANANGNAGYDNRGSAGRYGGSGGAAGSYDRTAAGSGGNSSRDYDSGGREQGRTGGSYDSPRDRGGYVTGASGARYDSPRGNGAGGGGGYQSGGRDAGYSAPQPAAGGSSRYGGAGGGNWAGASSKYGGGGGAAPAPIAAGGSSRYGGRGGGADAGYRGGAGPDRRGDNYAAGRAGDRHGPYDRPGPAR